MTVTSLSASSRQGNPGPDEIRLHLQRLFPLLAEFGSREEAQFVRIGRQLGDFLQRSRFISSSSEAVIDSLLRKEGEEVLASLHTLMDDLEEHIARLSADAHNHQDALKQVGDHLQRIESPLQGLVKVIKILYSLSFSTKVESTQGHSIVVLQALAEDLKGLAGKIQGKTDAVRDRLKTMWSLAAGAKAKTQLMADVALPQASSQLQQCRSLLDGVARRREAALTDARRLQDDSASIAAAIHEIISAIQFHDITRQQVEHVQIALGDFTQHLAGSDNDAQIGARTVDLCRIQAAQLGHTRHDIVSAVVRMIASLRGIAPSVQNLAQQTRSLATATEAVGESLFREVEPVLATVTNIIAAADQEDKDALAAVGAVLDVLSELSQLLQDVESIGTEMKMISLNAGITAAHNLERGAGLGVIARTIQTLSSEVLSRTEEFSAVYGEMDALARELSGAGNAGTESEVVGTTQLNAAAATFLARLQQVNHGGIELLQALDKNALSLAADVVASADRITIHLEAGKILDQLVSELEFLASSIHEEEDLVAEAEMLDLIALNYTMQSERRVHAEVRQSSSADVEPVGQDLTGLGMNVELF
ncbi:MAG: hypothetical protein IBX46_11395 [Desulfuromonadales bacterium]|nr:hypothetical protein [Desulfuromonadales bacterium]